MRLSNKLNIATGSVLLLVAAFFSISLALLPMDFGPAGPGTNNPLYIAACTLGDILFSVYGFSSILIPLFLFVAGISCFATKWTARKSMRLLTAIVPFFTSVIIEKICIAMLDEPDDFTSIKIILTAGVGLFLMAIEILAAGIFADRVNDFLFHRNGSSAESDENIQKMKMMKTKNILMKKTQKKILLKMILLLKNRILQKTCLKKTKQQTILFLLLQKMTLLQTFLILLQKKQ